MTSLVDTTVKFFNENFPGAPVLTNAVGSGLAVIRACLVTGFGLRTATGLTVSNGIATLTLAADAKNVNLIDSVILVAGATSKTELNGEQRVTAATDNTLQFATAASNGSASGTVTVKTASAGWTEAFTGTNIAAFKSAAVAGTGAYLRVQDTTTNTMRVVGYVSMTAVSTGSGPFPTSAQMSGGGYWAKQYSGAGSAVPWDVFADGRAIHWAPSPLQANYGAEYTGQELRFFGDLIAAKSIDPYSAVLTVGIDNTASGAVSSLWQGANSNQMRSYAARAYSGAGTSAEFGWRPFVGSAAIDSGTDPAFGMGPSPVDGSLHLSRLTALAGLLPGPPATQAIRGVFPGVIYVPQAGVAALYQRGDRVIPAAGELGGRKLYALRPGIVTPLTDTTSCVGFIDITGPWR